MFHQISITLHAKVCSMCWYLRTTKVRVLWELLTRAMASWREPLRATAFTLTISSPARRQTVAAALPSSTCTKTHTHQEHIWAANLLLAKWFCQCDRHKWLLFYISNNQQGWNECFQVLLKWKKKKRFSCQKDDRQTELWNFRLWLKAQIKGCTNKKVQKSSAEGECVLPWVLM